MQPAPSESKQTITKKLTFDRHVKRLYMKRSLHFKHRYPVSFRPKKDPMTHVATPPPRELSIVSPFRPVLSAMEFGASGLSIGAAWALTEHTLPFAGAIAKIAMKVSAVVSVMGLGLLVGAFAISRLWYKQPTKAPCSDLLKFMLWISVGSYLTGVYYGGIWTLLRRGSSIIGPVLDTALKMGRVGAMYGLIKGSLEGLADLASYLSHGLLKDPSPDVVLDSPAPLPVGQSK